MPSHEIKRLSSALHQNNFPLAVRLASRPPLDVDEAWRLVALEDRTRELAARAQIFIEDLARLSLTEEDLERLVRKVLDATNSKELDERTAFMDYLTQTSAALGEIANTLSIIFPDTYTQPTLSEQSPLTTAAGEI